MPVGFVSLRDWFAGQEALAEWDHPEAEPSLAMCEALAGPRPVHGWATSNSEEYLAMLRWYADWRAALKYLRADAMLKARARSEAGGAK